MYLKSYIASAAFLAVTVLASTSVWASSDDDVTIATYSIDTKASLMSDVRIRGISDSFNRPGARLEIDLAHESGMIALAQFNNVSKQEMVNGDGVGMLLGLGWRGGNPDQWHYGVGLASEVFPGAKFSAPQSFDFQAFQPTNVSNTNFNTNYAVLEFGYGRLYGRVIDVISKTYRGADAGGVCGAMLQYMADPTKALACYARGSNDSRGTLLFDLDYIQPLPIDTKMTFHVGYQSVANYPEADTFDYLLGITHTHWGMDWTAAVTGAIVRTPALYMYQDGDSIKRTDRPTLVLSTTYKF